MMQFLTLIFLISTLNTRAANAIERTIVIPALSCIGQDAVSFLSDDYEASYLRRLNRDDRQWNSKTPYQNIFLERINTLRKDFPELAKKILAREKQLVETPVRSIKTTDADLDYIIKPGECDVFAISGFTQSGSKFLWYRTSRERYDTGSFDQASILLQVITASLLSDKTGIGARVFSGYLFSQEWRSYSLIQKSEIIRQIGF